MHTDGRTAILRAVARNPPSGDRGPIKTTVELPEELWRAAKIRAMDDRVDLRTVFIRALEDFLGVPRKPITKRGRTQD